jgi:hypothetical protein
MHVTEVQQLIDRFAVFDVEIDAFYNHLLSTHPIIEKLHPTIGTREPTGDRCHDCDAPEIKTWTVDEERVSCCRNAIVAVKLLGAKHRLLPNDICLDCHVTTDGFGYPKQIYHQSKVREQQVISEDLTLDGLDAEIAAGVVDIDDATGIVSIKGEMVKSKLYEPTCSWRCFFRVPGGVICGDNRITPEMVGTPPIILGQPA